MSAALTVVAIDGTAVIIARIIEQIAGTIDGTGVTSAGINAQLGSKLLTAEDHYPPIPLDDQT